MRGIIRVSSFEASNLVVTRGLDQAGVKTNEAVGMKNFLDNSGVNKRLVLHFRRQEFWKCIGYILSSVTYGNKLHKLWGGEPKIFW